jgi:hypothetical protein
VNDQNWHLYVFDAASGEKLWVSETAMGGKLWRTWNAIAKSLLADIKQRIH